MRCALQDIQALETGGSIRGRTQDIFLLLFQFLSATGNAGET
jgi:hypothetical protein